MNHLARTGLCAGRSPIVLLASALVGVMGATPRQASSQPRRDVETIIVTGSNQPWAIADLPGSIDVITREEIEAGRYDGVLDVLREVPGLHADQPGVRGSRASVYTRGLDPNHTIVLLDGIMVNDPTNARGGSFDFSTLNPGDIERIEIVRGPLSAVHGSDAIAGAINIITRGGDGPDEIAADLSGGRFGYFRGYGRLSGERGPLDFALAGSYVDEGDPSNIGDYRGGTLHASLGLDLPKGVRTRGTLRFNDSRNVAFPEFSGGKELAVIREREKREIEELSAGLTLGQAPLPWFEYALRGSMYRRRENRRSPGVAPSAGDPLGIPAEPGTRDRLHRYHLSMLGTARAPFSLSLTAGGDVTWEEGRSSGELVSPFPFLSAPIDIDLDRVVGGPFAEAHWDCDCGLVLLAGVRADFPDGDAAEVTPRVSGSYGLPKLRDWLDLEVTGSWGKGFKLPSFFALGNPLVGNPDLRSERSHGGDVGVAAALWKDRLEARVSYFDITVRNLIDFNPDAFVLENLRKVRSRGVEMGARAVPFERLGIDGHFTYADTEDEDTGRRLRNRPRWRGGVALHWSPLDSLTMGVRALFVGDVLDASVPTAPAIVKLGSYERVDLVLSWAPRDWIEAYLAVDNLFDADYQEAVGFPAVGIHPRAGIRIHLSRDPLPSPTESEKVSDTW